MSSYLSSILTTTTSRYNALRKTLLNDEGDGDTEDDTHMCRVLRAYYIEKGRPFPPWLPPDPKNQQAPVAPSPVSSLRQQPAQPTGGRGGLSDLWGSSSQQQQAPQEPTSLRRGAGPPGRTPVVQARTGGIADAYGPSQGGLQPASQGRPLPSQRAGSIQNAYAQRQQADPSPPPSSGGGISAQERLKARLWGSGRSTSPVQSSTASTGSTQRPGVGQSGSYGSERGGGLPYPDEGRCGGGGRQQMPYTSSNPPWVSGDDMYAPGGPYDQQRQSGGRVPLGRDKVGLPSGPRPQR